MKRLLILSILMFALLGCSQLQTAPQETKYTKYNHDYFSIDYPGDWNLEQNKTEAYAFAEFLSKQETSRDTVLDELIVEVWVGNPELSIFEDFETLEKRLLYEGEKISSSERITFKGNEALKIEISGIATPENPVPIKKTSIYFKLADAAYRIHYGFEVGKETKFQPILDKMLDSFEAKAPIEGETQPKTETKPELQEVKYTNYSDPHYSIIYPEDWNAEKGEPEAALSVIDFTSRKETLNDTVQEDLIVEVFSEFPGFSTFEDFEKLEKLILLEGEKITSTQKITFKGKEVLKIEIDGMLSPENVKVKKTAIFFKNGEIVYAIHYAFEASKESKFKPIFEKMLESFEIKTPPKQQLPTEPQNIEYIKYSYAYFSIDYPKTWNVDESTYGHSIDFYSRKEDINDPVSDDLLVEVFSQSTDFRSFDDFEAYEKTLLYEGDKITSTKTITFKGRPAIQINMEGAVQGAKLKIATIYFKDNDSGKIFRISYLFEASKESKFKPIFDKMLNSFKVR